MVSVVKVEPLRLDVAPHAGATRFGFRGELYRHQAELFDRWTTRDVFVLFTPTGSGKTQAALLPCLAHRDSAIFLYPTNALIEDQVRSFHELASRTGTSLQDLSGREEAPQPDASPTSRARICRVDADTLDELRRYWMFRTKGRALATLLNHQEQPLLLLTNPDTLFLLIALRYAESVSALGALDNLTLVIDEFHLYSGAALARLLFMVYFLLRAPRRMVARVVFLSATPSDEITAILRELFDPLFITHAPASGESCRIVQHQLILDAVPISGRVSTQMAETIRGRREQLLGERRILDDQGRAGAVPLLAITNSVFGSIALEDTLRSAPSPWRATEIGVYRGLSNRSIRDTNNKLVVLGTSAIEVGVDFDTSSLVFEAGSAESLLQRIGRLGRHGPGSATLFAPAEVARQITADAGAVVSRDELASLASHWYPLTATYAWFAQSRHGLSVARATLQGLYELADQQGVTELRDQIRVLVREYADAIGAERAPGRFSQWVGPYSRVQSFRGSASISVYDHIEAARRLEAASTPRHSDDLGRYEADLGTILRFGNSISERTNRRGELYAVIAGYTKPRDVRVLTTLADPFTIWLAESVAAEFVTGVNAPRLCAYFRHPGHICVLLPDHFEPYLKRDWRIRYYLSRYGVMLFDDDALLALAMYERENTHHAAAPLPA